MARECTSLENYSNQIIVWTSGETGFTFINCLSLGDNEESKISVSNQLELVYERLNLGNIHLQPLWQRCMEEQMEQIDQSKACHGVFRETEIPEWFCHQNPEGSSVPIPLSHDLYENSGWRGIALCTIFEVDKNLNNEDSPSQDSKCFHEFICRLDIDGGVFDSPMVFTFPKDKFCHGSFGLWIYIPHARFRGHLDVRGCISPSITTKSPDVEIKMCGARIVYEEDMVKFVQNFSQEVFGSPDVLRQCHKEFIEYHKNSSESSNPCLKRELKTLLSILYQEDPARNHWYDYIFPQIQLPRWFNYQNSVSDTRMQLPPDLHNITRWMGFSVYVLYTICKQPAGSGQDSTIILSFSGISAGEAPFASYRAFPLSRDIFVGARRLLVFYIPRLLFGLNQCSEIWASFQSNNPDVVKIEMCGIRLVYEQDSEEFVETLVQCMLECPNQYHESYHLNLLAQVEELQRCNHGKDFSCSFSLQRRPRMPKLLPSIENVAEEEGCTSSETFSNQAGTSTSLILGVPLRDEQCGSTTSSIGALEDWFKLYLKHTHNNRDAFSLCFPQSEIPQWFCHKNDHKPSVGILLPPNLYYNPDWMGFAVCGVFSFHKHPTAINLDSGFRHCFMCHLATDLGCVSPLFENCIGEAQVRIYQRSFIWLLFLPRWLLSQQWSEATWVNFSFVSDSPHVSALKCGVGLVYRENMEEFNATYVQLMTSFVATVEDIRSSLSLPQISYPPPLEKEMQCEDPHPVHNTGPLDFHPSSSFNYCFPPSKVTQEWFSHKSRGHSVTIDMPPNLYNDNNWMGLALCACFSIDGDSEALTGNWVSKIPHFVHCLFQTSEAGLDDYVHMWGTNGADIMWLIDLGRFIWISYQPGDPFRYLLRQCSSIEASIVSDWPGVTVQKCGLHLLYQHDRVEFEQKLKHCNDLMFEYVESINPLKYDLAKIFGQNPDQEVGLTPTPDDHSMKNFLNQTFKRPIDQAETDQLGISDLMDFDGCSEFNLCLPPREILHWFSHQSNEPSVKIDVPTNLYDDSGWMGLLLCVYFSVHDQDQTEKLDSAISHQLICRLKSNVVGPEPEIHDHGTTKQELRRSYIQDEFLWLSYIPRGSLPGWLNQCSCLEASFLNDSPGLMVQKCGLRFFHVHDEEFEKIIFRWGFYPSIPIDQGESSGDENQPCNNQDFDPCLFYNSCFPPNEILDSFSHQSDEPSVTIRLPPNLYDDPTWMGLALCVFFSVQEHYTIPCNLNCLLETALGSLEIPLVYCLNEEDLMLLRLGGFIWLSYIPRGSFPNWLNQSSFIQALIATNYQGLTAQRCGLRLLYQNEEIEFKQTIRQLSLTRDDKAAEPSATSSSDGPRLKDNGKRIVEE